MNLHWESRLEQLERRLGRYQWATAVAIMIFVLALVSGQSTKPTSQHLDVVSAQAFRLVDEEGSVRGAWQLNDEDSPFFTLCDKKNRREQIGLWASSEGAGLSIRDARGQPRCLIGVDADGSSMIRLLDENQQPSGIWSASADGKSQAFSLGALGGSRHIMLGVLANGQVSIALADSSGRKRGHWFISPNGHTQLAIQDDRQRARAILGNLDVEDAKGVKMMYPESSLHLIGKDGEPTFRAP